MGLAREREEVSCLVEMSVADRPWKGSRHTTGWEED